MSTSIRTFPGFHKKQQNSLPVHCNENSCQSNWTDRCKRDELSRWIQQAPASERKCRDTPSRFHRIDDSVLE